MAQVDRGSVDPALKAVQTRKARYALFKVESTDEKISIVLDKQSERGVAWKDFRRDLKDNAPRYCIYDYEFVSADGRSTSSMYFVYWLPHNCNQNDRILYSSGKTSFVALLNGYKHFTAEEKDEIEEIFKNEVVSK